MLESEIERKIRSKMETCSDIGGALVSKPYYEQVHLIAESPDEQAKALGQFYTNSSVADKLAEGVASCLLKRGKILNEYAIVDPFCGDGRLITHFLKICSKLNMFTGVHFKVKICDVSEEAVQAAYNSIDAIAKELHINVDIEANRVDSYVYYKDVKNSYDICLTNPPWGLLKPLKKVTEHCSETEAATYKDTMRAYANYMASEFAIAKSTRNFGDLGINFARCGWIVALELLKKEGMCGIVSPASIFTDHISSEFRKWLFEHYNVFLVEYFPAEMKLYGKADISSITAIVEQGTTSEVAITKNLTNKCLATYQYSKSEWSYIKAKDYVLPLTLTNSMLRVLQRMESLETLDAFSRNNKLKFVRELDETRVTEKLKSTGTIRFLKGHMVSRYKVDVQELYLNQDVYPAPVSCSRPKLVWRDVSRSSQLRRMQATFIGGNTIAGNSLGVLSSENGNEMLLKCLLGILNSWVAEFFVRPQLVTNHISSGVLKTLKLPKVFCSNALLNMVEQQLHGKDVQSKIDAHVAKLYSLTKEEYVGILEEMEVSRAYREEIVKAW